MRRLLSHIIALSALSAAAIAAPLRERASYVQGIDLGNFGLPVDWEAAASQGVAFAYIQATQGGSTCLKYIITAASAASLCVDRLPTDLLMTAVESQFAANYAAAANNGIIHGAIHYADPGGSAGSTQANFFYKNGGLYISLCRFILFSLSGAGAWTRDGATLPGAVQLEGTTSSLMISQSILTL
jgi:hypothetical protein